MSVTLQPTGNFTTETTGDQFPPLRDGARMRQAEFHLAYERTPEHVKAELIEGVVYMASPLGIDHGEQHFNFATPLGMYVLATPGVRGTDNATVILGDEDEPQPDLALRILPEYGGQTRKVGKYIFGAPELIVEVADSSRAIDLHAKRRAYAAHGGIEYLVVDLEGQRVHWLDLRTGQEIPADAEGVCRIRVFPGLWIDAPALLAHDGPRVMATLNAGLVSPEHTAFVAALATRTAGH